MAPRLASSLVSIVLALSCMILCFVGTSQALKCFKGVYDCFYTVCHENENISDPPTTFNTTGTSCAFATTNEGTWEWSCGRNFKTCKARDITPNCIPMQLGKARERINGKRKDKEYPFTEEEGHYAVAECATDEVCFNHYRRPQNSRHGKSPVWGFERVSVVGCMPRDACAAAAATDYDPMNTGINMQCCDTDLCNAAARDWNTLGTQRCHYHRCTSSCCKQHHVNESKTCMYIQHIIAPYAYYMITTRRNDKITKQGKYITLRSARTTYLIITSR